MGSVKSVIFDMDGVIFDTERLYIECCKAVSDKYNMGDEAFVEALCHRCIGVTSKVTRQNILDTYGQDFPIDAYFDDSTKIFMERFGDGKHLIKPGVPELFQYLKEEGFRIALASSTKTATLTKELDDAGLLQNFDVVVGGDQVTRSKPDPDIFLMAAEKLDARPEECYVLEDSFNGIRAANAAGMIPVMVPDLLAPDDEMREKAEVILDSLYDVIEYLKGKKEKICFPDGKDH